ncbi:WhiB family transcriptional regulator [Gordonia sp. AC31]|uniref:WhiB family transcriptional regulator n=1 Tax=Gordonia sp. AC31 TaxID=2962571 RepID=UPI002881C8B1|nr:WhiB family transcriptional regulator [Gordonia sp. AC31]MDT0223500.1 WhiB family transcriptional regulator [Gordonia sp. AC31]
MSNNQFKTWIRDNTEPWHWNALCASVGGDFWHPEKGESAEPARLICNRCPVKDQCLQWALDNYEKDGIYGGVTAKERHRMVKERAA